MIPPLSGSLSISLPKHQASASQPQPLLHFLAPRTFSIPSLLCCSQFHQSHPSPKSSPELSASCSFLLYLPAPKPLPALSCHLILLMELINLPFQASLDFPLPFSSTLSDIIFHFPKCGPTQRNRKYKLNWAGHLSPSQCAGKRLKNRFPISRKGWKVENANILI